MMMFTLQLKRERWLLKTTHILGIFVHATRFLKRFTSSTVDGLAGKYFIRKTQRMQRQMSGKQVPSILAIAPAELEFPSCNTSELGKISRSMHLTNKTDNLIVFKIKATPTNSVKYSALPLVGYVLPKATRDVAVWMRTPIEAPLSLQHRDEIIVQSARVPKSITASDLTTELINFLLKLLKEKSCSNFERKVMSVIASPPPAEEQPPMMRSVFCLKNKKRIKDIEKVEDCFILEFDPYESFDLSSLSKCLEEVQDAPNIAVVAEKGQVACRDYPHPRHLCVVHPFNKTRHETHCNMCYCCVCDSPAPCKKWAKKSSNIAAKHCDATGNRVYEGRVNRIWHYGVQ